jgi:hypothetical protein
MKKLQPAIAYMRENPTATVKEICEKFMLSKTTVYNMRHHYGLGKKVVKPVINKKLTNQEDRKEKLINRLLEEVVRQKAIIDYLESKLTRHGVTV